MRNNAAYLPESPIVYIILPKSIRNRASFYIFVLIQLETFALLTGSLGLFIILAMVMYFSKKIDWFNE